ncbi:hypothetical protein Pryu01_00602 [Paraliobacillus ryukyuensis]|uniref:Competence protein ComEA n=1 Tax=Paraliobacillus ryukyuensis TaxID=200904 RepID=A0A366EG12_9BACI|nr:helix-hairpin-helix domain-containing protein [Paraliobacillus ryukyuensis]RBP01332.1 competence protein ComEA [Paraliobacillus ryukyuensis]
MKDFISKNWLICTIIFGVILFSGWTWFQQHPKQEANNFVKLNDTQEIDTSIAAKQESSMSNQQFVDVKGEVKHPDIYEISGEERVKEVIALAGGFTDEADTSAVNLAQKVTDEMVIIVPEIGSSSNNNTAEPEGETTSPLRINQATIEELQTLPGIGAVKAEAIHQYKQENGPFQRLEDLQSITGIGSKTVEKLEPYIQVP